MSHPPDRSIPDRSLSTPLSRRSMVAAGGGLAATALAGCLGGSSAGGEVPAPVSLDEGQACDECGMIIQDYPGPTGQVYFESLHDDRDGPAWFCSGICAYSYRFDRVETGATPIGTYLTDYSPTEYDLSDDSEPFISAALDADTFALESELFVVAGSEVRGAMGPDVIPFSVREDADSFASTYGGSVRQATAVDRDLIDGIKASTGR